MKKFIPLQKGRHRPARSEVKSDVGPIETQMEVDPVGEPTPDLGIGPSTSPTSGLLVSREQESSGTQTYSFQMNHLTSISRNPDRKTTSNLIRSVFGTGSKRDRTNSSDDTADPREASKSKLNLKSLASSGAKFILRGVKESADVFPPLKSTAGALCFIIDNCEVCSASVRHPFRVFMSITGCYCVSSSDRVIDTSGPGASTIIRRACPRW